MKKIITSVAMIAAVGAVVIGAARAYFSDTETSVGNTFTAGTIDIAVDGENPWENSFTIGDLKPCETGYMNFNIQNVGQNPVNISKRIYNMVGNTGIEEYDCSAVDGKTSSEPECVAEANGRIDNVQSQIIYDLYVEVYVNENASDPIWWQAIYEDEDGMKLTDIYDGDSYVELGMIPVGGYMKVTQSYHFDCEAGNEYQGDIFSFDMEIKGEQLTDASGYASVVLENKEKGADGIWDIVGDDVDSIKGILKYKTSGSEFEYEFSGTAPLSDHAYVLAVGYDANTDVDTKIGEGTTDSSGYIELSGSFNTGDLEDAKAWLVPAENWDDTNDQMDWTGWDISEFLWETGLIDYDDIDS